jgi:hypothetical protein
MLASSSGVGAGGIGVGPTLLQATSARPLNKSATMIPILIIFLIDKPRSSTSIDIAGGTASLES